MGHRFTLSHPKLTVLVKEAKVESSSSDGADYGKNGGYDCGVCHGTGQV